MPKDKELIYPSFINGVLIKSPLDHAAYYAERAHTINEPYVAVPVELLRRIARFRECGVRRTFDSDEDGPMTPLEVACRKEAGHDDASNLEHVRQHSNGYYVWLTE